MKVRGSQNNDFQMPEPGTYVGRCFRIIDLGTQTGDYQGKPYARRQVVLEWELPTEQIQGGEWDGLPMTVRKFYTASLGEKANLRHDLTNWRGKDFTPEELEGFALEKLLGVACLISLTENENGRRKVTGVAKLPRGTTVPPQVNASVMFSLEPGEFNRDVFDGLSDWFKDTIAKTPEYRECIDGPYQPPFGSDDPDLDDGDSIPF